jgi:hypothetical protein
MNEHFWDGFEKVAISALTRGAAHIMGGIRRGAKSVANKALDKATTPGASNLMTNVGGKAYDAANWVAKNPGKSALGAGAVGLGGAGLMMSRRDR